MKQITTLLLFTSHNTIAYIDIIYRIGHLFCIVLELDRGKPPLSTERYSKFIDFWSIIHCFQFETINQQEFGFEVRLKGNDT